MSVPRTEGVIEVDLADSPPMSTGRIVHFVHRRSIMMFLALALLFMVSTVFIRASMSTQKEMIDIADITYDQRLELKSVAETVEYLLEGSDESIPDRLIQEAQSNLKKTVVRLQQNHQNLLSVRNSVGFNLIAIMQDRVLDDMLQQIALDLNALERNLEDLMNGNIYAMKAGFENWRPEYLDAFYGGQYTERMSVLNKRIYESVAQRVEFLGQLQNAFLFVVFMGMAVVWFSISMPMVRQLKRQFIEIQQGHERLRNQAITDSLTGLLNRDYLKELFELDTQHHRTGLALIALDIDDFKVINDTHGHLAGDQVLREVAKRLSHSALHGEKQFRVGGDEFILAFEQVMDEAQILERAKYIIDTCAQFVMYQERAIPVRLSVGVAWQSDKQETLTELHSAADFALYHIKERGGDGYTSYADVSVMSIADLLTFEKRLIAGIAAKEFEAFYQPIIDAKLGKVVGLEALARWMHPTRGAILPAEWWAIAKRLGVLSQITLDVVETAYAHMQRLIAQGVKPVPVSINATKNLLLSGEMLQVIQHANEQLSRQGYPALLNVEVPESIVLDQNFDIISQQMAIMQQSGVGIYLDDFGTGYATLSHLVSLPFDTLKIDKQFVQKLTSNDKCRVVTKSIIDLAAGLDKQLISEGVEDEATLALLLSLGGRYIQGIYYSHPVPFDELLVLFNKEW